MMTFKAYSMLVGLSLCSFPIPASPPWLWALEVVERKPFAEPPWDSDLDGLTWGERNEDSSLGTKPLGLLPPPTWCQSRFLGCKWLETASCELKWKWGLLVKAWVVPNLWEVGGWPSEQRREIKEPELGGMRAEIWSRGSWDRLYLHWWGLDTGLPPWHSHHCRSCWRSYFILNRPLLLCVTCCWFSHQMRACHRTHDPESLCPERCSLTCVGWVSLVIVMLVLY